ncbi:hypothetical protein [Aeromonas intestinalis]
MGISDHEYVNFSEDYELNYHLKKVSKAQTEKNRTTLRTMGKELKTMLNKERVTHTEFHSYILKNLSRLDS